MNNGVVFMGVLNRTSDAVLMIDKAPACAGELPIKPAHTEQKSPLRELHRTLLTADTQNWALLEASGLPNPTYGAVSTPAPGWGAENRLVSPSLLCYIRSPPLTLLPGSHNARCPGSSSFQVPFLLESLQTLRSTGVSASLYVPAVL